MSHSSYRNALNDAIRHEKESLRHLQRAESRAPTRFLAGRIRVLERLTDFMIGQKRIVRDADDS